MEPTNKKRHRGKVAKPVEKNEKGQLVTFVQ